MAEVSNPFSQFMVMATFIHETYTAFLSAGFTTDQAFELTTLILSHTMMNIGGNG
jgi:hypothetical protein